jgi:hypothetical protein
MDFGGMWGWVAAQETVNPATGQSSCPAGYNTTHAYGTYGEDYDVFYCWRPHVDGRNPVYDFGGMWGYVNATVVVNPTTGQASCPAGYTDQQVLGTINVDWSLHACYAPHPASAPVGVPALFGGMVGTVAGVTTNDPASGAPSCPAGFTAQQVLGGGGVDLPLTACWAPPPCPGGVALADTHACVTLTPWDGNPLPSGAKIAMRAKERLVGTSAQPFGPAWVTLTPFQLATSLPTYEYLDASGANLSSSAIFTVTSVPQVAGEYFGDGAPTSLYYQKLLIQGSNGMYPTLDMDFLLEASVANPANAPILLLDLSHGTNAALWFTTLTENTQNPVSPLAAWGMNFMSMSGHTFYRRGAQGLTAAGHFEIYLVN